MSVTAVQPVQKERVRGPYLRVLVSSANGVPFERALVLAEGANGVIASNKRLDKALVGSGEWQRVKEVFTAWSGTMTAYVAPGQRLGRQVEYTDFGTNYRWVFSVPEAHQDKTNAILVAEHPDYTLELDGNNRVVHAAKVDLVEAFPVKNDWYFVDSVHGIPTGREVDSQDSRYLWRIDKRVGPVARYFYDNTLYSRQSAGLYDRPSDGYGVAVEASEAGPEYRNSLAVQQAEHAPLEPMQLRLTREGPDTLIVKGTPEQLDAAVQLLGRLGQQITH
ncbi:MAG TPA: hypothetical protein VJH24_02570 [Candidatus Bilamarchaeaceae archaeon]|nr:hypothetical protein [Candidatus Bilamarchaeaceae archaeon]